MSIHVLKYYAQILRNFKLLGIGLECILCVSTND